MYKVFNQHKLIIFTEKLTIYKICDTDFIHHLSDENKMYAVYQNFMLDDKFDRLFFVSEKNLEISVNKFFLNFKLIEAAGGLIINPRNELLMIYRLGKWDLPKGKIEKNETVKEAAIRECMEETGLKELSIIEELDKVYHIYAINGRPVLKITRWFKMISRPESLLTPQTEEGIEMVEWMNKSRVREVINGTFESLKDLIESNYLKK